jgi:hypothetical protein
MLVLWCCWSPAPDLQLSSGAAQSCSGLSALSCQVFLCATDTIFFWLCLFDLWYYSIDGLVVDIVFGYNPCNEQWLSKP